MQPRRLLVAALIALVISTAVGIAMGTAWGLAAALVQVGCMVITVLCAPRATDTTHEHADAGRQASEIAESDEPLVSEHRAQPRASNDARHASTEAPSAEPSHEVATVLVPDGSGGHEAQPDDAPPADEQHAHVDEQEPIAPIEQEQLAPVEQESSIETADDGFPTAETSSFAFEEFAQELLSSPSPLGSLFDFCEKAGSADDASTFERFLARRLGEADVATLAAKDDFFVRIALPHHSGCFYVQELQSTSFAEHVQILKIEEALNAARFAYEYYDNPNTASEEDLMRLEQRHAKSVCSQVPNVETSDWSYLAMPWQASWGPTQHGEWAVRSSLSQSIEELDVPFRLEAKFRSNVAQGDVAIEVQATHPRVMPASVFVDGLGIIPTTSSMRAREASKYNAHMGILLANCAFRASQRIRRVWLASIQTTPSKRSCLFWACFERRQFSHVRMDAIGDPIACLGRLGASVSLENETFQPVEQGFYLEDQRFCPPVRHDLWKMSERILPPSAALSLGTSRVSGLVIHEELPRILASEEAMLGLPTTDEDNSCEKSVRSVLQAASKTSDIDVWNAAERVVSKLVDGTLSPSDPQALQRELVSGDVLSHAVRRAQEHLMQGHPDEALKQLETALRSIDGTGTYQDTPSVVYRSFDSFAERALYNRLNAHDNRCLVLVPDAYVVAHLAMAAILQARAQAEDGSYGQQALLHAERALEVAPLSTNAHLSTVFCFEHSGDLDKAESALRDMLEMAHDPQGVGLAYYRMASIQWKLGHHTACRACYQLAAGVAPALLPLILAECHVLLSEEPQMSTPLDGSEVEQALKERDIPLAPTNRISFLIYDCATASIDAEVFPVAQDLMRILESFTGDDVIHGIRTSLESEPDQ